MPYVVSFRVGSERILERFAIYDEVLAFVAFLGSGLVDDEPVAEIRCEATEEAA